MSWTVTPLFRLLLDQRPDDSKVAFGAQNFSTHNVNHDDYPDWKVFRRDVKSLCVRLEKFGRSDWLIADDNAYAIAVGIFASLHIGCRAVLPANLQSGHLADLALTVGGVISDAKSLSCATNCVPFFDSDPGDVQIDLAPLDDAIAEIVLHTSGTTGDPVAIRKPLSCLDAEIAVLEKTFGIRLPATPQGGIHSTVPAYHIYGLLFRILWPLATARPLATHLINFPEELVSTSANTAVSIFVTSPAFLKRAQPVLDFDYLNSCQSLIISSGGLLPPEVAASYNRELDQPIVEVYGSTETGGIGYRSVCDAAVPSHWTPLPGVDLSIDPDKEVLTVRSPFIPAEDWIVTGDRARIGEDGCFELNGRADQIVKIEEVRISLADMEQRLSNCLEVEAVTVLPLMTHNRVRQSLVAVIQPSYAGWKTLAKNGKHVLEETLLAALKPYFSTIALPRKWRFVRQFSENDSGKMTRAAFENLFTADQGRTVAPTILRNDVEPGAVVLRLRLVPDLTYFEGHFDSEPILAGVVQIDWAIEFAMDFFPITGTFRRIEALKFFKVLFPGQDVTLELRYDVDLGRLNFCYINGDTKYSSGRVMFEEAM